ncbi:phage head-tail connector protein [Cytobacillus praedii]|uniref:phage head-tail connector protein n=1 Tax=Cytobacillus praedii TaxID=1742358 RepID=UPI003F7DB998
MNVLEIIKAKIPAENLPSDKLLNMYIEEVGQSILTFCNRTDIPAELNFVYANMIIDLIASENNKTNPEANRVVTSIKEGDTQISYGSSISASESSTIEIVNNYKSQLLRYRKLRW